MPPKKDATAGDAPLAETNEEPVGEGLAIISEEAMAAHTATLEALAEEHGLDTETLVGDLRDAMLSLFKHRLKPWGQMLAGDQRDVAGALELAAQTFVRKAVNMIAAGDRPNVRGRLKKFSHDGGKIVATIEVPLTDDGTILAINHACGQEVLIITADPNPFGGERRGADVDEDQADLGFQAGSDRHPPDDSDLADAGAESLEDES